MEDPLRNVSFSHAFGLVVSVRVESMICHHMVFQDGLEVFLAVIAEEESIYSGSKLLEREVRRSKDGPSNMVRSIIQGFDKSGLGKSKL